MSEMKKRVTDYCFDNPDDEALPITRCACGAKFQPWFGPVVGVESSEPTEMPCCGRLIWFSQVITIHEAPNNGD